MININITDIYFEKKYAYNRKIKVQLYFTNKGTNHCLID